MGDQRFPGEPPDSRTIEDILQWVGVYAEMTRRLARMHLKDEDRAAIGRRYEFWVGRLRELVDESRDPRVLSLLKRLR